jgi:hypothetical protein
MADIASIGNINGSASGWIVEIGGGSVPFRTAPTR